MIARNFIKYPEAMALQLVLMFGRPVWNTTRPTTRIGRAIRQAQAKAVKATPQLVAWVKSVTPQWFKDQARRAKSLAESVKRALTVLVWDLMEVEGPAMEKEKTALEKMYEDAKKCERGYLHAFCPISSVIARPHWGEKWFHGRIGVFYMRQHNYREHNEA